MMEMTSHYFIAIPVESAQFETVQQSILPYYSYRRVYRRDEFHVTIQFLGGLDQDSLEAVKEITRRVANETKSFLLHFQTIDHFGRPDQPRVLTITPDPSEPLRQFAENLRRELHAEIPQLDRKAFVPHVTLAKKWGKGERTLYVAPTFDIVETVNEVILYEVHPNRTPSYEAIEVFPFKRSEEDLWQSRLKFLT
ncbi:RNA 2',3'-cyclic phosphodiesterase [Exiguobacterium algae]|uniref:RNA 2',3'-cyclic phosphodiesterase n=1 Tax=Exiguobacterium algae TaxID=2751250 RepID=UPI001F0A7A3C|nr:RNA 2',3'-cyclic phosphodiesterase [Exiguobacterium algae]